MFKQIGASHGGTRSFKRREYVTIGKKSIAFGADFLKKHGVEKLEFTRFYVDEDAGRLAILFDGKVAAGCVKLSCPHSKKGGRTKYSTARGVMRKVREIINEFNPEHVDLSVSFTATRTKLAKIGNALVLNLTKGFIA